MHIQILLLFSWNLIKDWWLISLILEMLNIFIHKNKTIFSFNLLAILSTIFLNQIQGFDLNKDRFFYFGLWITE